MENMDNFLTVFTPTYNRSHTLERVYQSLVNQTFKNFEWIIIDDGSYDNTRDIVNKMKENGDFEIIYIYQKNQGKHIAMNKAINKAKGDFFIIADSDDSFKAESFELLLSHWEKIPDKLKFKGISCRCIDESGNLIGNKNFPSPNFDSNELDIKYKYKYNFELWGMTKTQILRDNLNPEIMGLRFFPETIMWDRIAQNYKTRYINIGLRTYYSDQSNATMNASSNTRYEENYYLWLHYINEVFSYYFLDIVKFEKALIGITRDGTLKGLRLSDVLVQVNKNYKKALIILHYPLSRLLLKFNR